MLQLIKPEQCNSAFRHSAYQQYNHTKQMQLPAI